ncbi:DUF3800 domain-containing protein [Sanguibacter suaedae]|uniref:DUF3800 domain-containing protein n=1 Tax=Sanguibacter suaedae TaxID=2795737 RepID=A0A934MBV9_9MICO|nr:DUF3800 domain-containing protein [Sanguibacter suaedae]MBI9115736.1 DUF3800 domain-containing protein [Sanguibacter suaedae]
MLLAYVDESYAKDQYFCLGAIVVDSDAASTIERGLDELVVEYSSSTSLPMDAELHGYELFHGKGDWSCLKLRQLINVYGRAMHIIGTSGARLIFRSMDVARQLRRYSAPYPPHDVVLGHVLESIESVAADIGDHVVVIADEVHSEERHRTNFRSFRRLGTPGYQSSTLPHLLDTLHFAPSKHSRLLQAADLVTFMHRRRNMAVDTDPRAIATSDRIWASVADSVVRSWHWAP